ncbi:uncharacterized protein LOC120637936 [Pararge aegeria]|uniref:uncharacterized protein LOC120637936 n=1 Tax=Pararge aegeria TaxID=116150 RepID=UPI0019D218BA|nr:uncharacterized protein LOC120637936 [Pararge aegeria]
MSAEDQKACYNVRRLLEMLRKSFHTGIYKIPPLDPYINNNFSPVTLNVPLLTGEVDVAQVIVTGLQAFNIELIEMRLDTNRSDFIFSVPLVNGVVYFQANLALGGLFPMSIKGRLRVQLQNVKVDGAVGGHENIFPPKHFYSLTALQTHFHADNVKVRLDGLNLEKDVLESLQSLGTNIALEPIKKVVNYYVAQEILKQMNRIIENFSVAQVNAYLLAR